MRILITFLLVLSSLFVHAQKDLDRLLKQFNTQDVPYISVQELAMPKTDALIFDARESEEFEVSHLKNAVFVGYNTFKVDTIQKNYSNKNQMIVVYCSLGIRSETIADKLTKAGYNNVYNLYGGIFEWKNADFPVFNSEEKETDNVHAFSKDWSKWLLKGKKIYD